MIGLGIVVYKFTDPLKTLGHNAVFGKDGEVVSGPPPRPLDRYDVKIENDQIFILGG